MSVLNYSRNSLAKQHNACSGAGQLLRFFYWKKWNGSAAGFAADP